MSNIMVTVLRQKVLHDGLSMLVLKPGAENPPIPLALIAGLVEEGSIEKPDGWEPGATSSPANFPSADGAVFTPAPPAADPVTHDLVRFGEAGPSVTDLERQPLTSLIAIAVAEGVIDDPEDMRLALVEAIRAKRAGGFDAEREAEGDGVDKTPFPAEPVGDGSFAGTATLGGEGAPLPPGVPQEGEPLRLSDEERARLPQLDHDGDGKPGGDKAEDELALVSAGFTLTEAGGGWWHITGPGLDKPVKLRGEDDARARFDELVAAAATAGDAGGEGEAPA